MIRAPSVIYRLHYSLLIKQPAERAEFCSKIKATYLTLRIQNKDFYGIFETHLEQRERKINLSVQIMRGRETKSTRWLSAAVLNSLVSS
jgi:hypothetical protein